MLNLPEPKKRREFSSFDDFVKWADNTCNKLFNSRPIFNGSVISNYAHYGPCNFFPISPITWHLIKDISKNDNGEMPCPERISKIHWIEYIISADHKNPDNEIIAFPYRHKPNMTRVNIYDKGNKYLVVLEPHKKNTSNKYTFITAYPVNKKGYSDTLRRRYLEYKKTLKENNNSWGDSFKKVSL